MLLISRWSLPRLLLQALLLLLLANPTPILRRPCSRPRHPPPHPHPHRLHQVIVIISSSREEKKEVPEEVQRQFQE
jgi:hypothetical protein